MMPRHRALKFRYHILLEGFDAKVVATKAQGWEDMLRKGLELWVNAVVAEKKEDIQVAAEASA